MTGLFNVLGTLVTLYSIACFIRVIITWFPQVSFSSFARFLYRICDPYLNIFKRMRFLHTSTLDFSPMLALAVLVGISNIFTRMATMQKVSVGYILAIAVQMLWSVCSSIIVFLIFIIIVRLVADIVAPKSSFQLWSSLDRILYPVISPITAPFSNSGRISWRTSLIIGGVFFILANMLLGWIIGKVSILFALLPF
jgi:YggT family protein